MRHWKRCAVGVLMLPLISFSAVSGVHASELSKAHAPTKGYAASMAQGAAYVPGQLIVRFKDGKRGFSASALQSRGKILARADKAALLEVPADKAVQLAAELAHDPNVAYVEPNYRYRSAEAPHDGGNAVNDPRYPEQWGLPAVDAPAAWDELSSWSGPKADQVVVAVVDTGVDAGHPDLAGRVLNGYNVIDDSPDASDDNGHGTHVSGIIAARTDNGEGVAGVAGRENVKILPIKVLDADGSGTSLDVAKGIDKAVEMGANIINLSLGGPGDSKLVHEAIQNAAAKGVLVVAAAGNSADDTAGYYPARYPETVAVAALDESLEPTYFSNYGSPVDLAAPGEHVLSTFPGGDYVMEDGTSMAAPFVAGAAALVKLAHPTWSAPEIRAALEHTARDIGQPGLDAGTGYGLVQAAAAVEYQSAQASLQILEPQPGTYVSGTVHFRVRAAGEAVQVAFSEKGGKALGTAPVSGGEAVFDWDSARVADGNHTIVAQAQDAGGRALGASEQVMLRVRNQAKGSAVLHVLDPDGMPAYGARVTVMRLEEDGGSHGFLSAVMQSYVNDQGLVYLPSSVLLPDERYVAVAEYYEEDQNAYYVQYQDITEGNRRYDIRMGDTVTAGVQVVSGNSAYPVGSASILFVPILQGVESDWWGIYETDFAAGAESLHLPPGRYAAYAVGQGEDGQSFRLRQEVTITADTTVSFDLAKAKKVTFRLPDWAEAGIWYPNDNFPYTLGATFAKGQSIYVTPGTVDGYALDLIAGQDGEPTDYTLETDKPLDLSRSRIVTVPGSAVLEKDAEAGEDLGSYQPEEIVELPYLVKFGRDYTLTWVEKIWGDWDGMTGLAHGLAWKDPRTKHTLVTGKPHGLILPDSEEAPQTGGEGPQVVLTDSHGREAWRGDGLYELELPDASHLKNGVYQVAVDFTGVPFSAEPSRLSLGRLEIGKADGEPEAEVSVSVVAPDQSRFAFAGMAVIDPDSGEWVGYDLAGADPDDGMIRLRYPDLASDKEYRFVFSGLLEDGTPVYADRVLEVTSDSLTLDLSSDRNRPVQVDVELAEGTQADLLTDDSVFPPLLLDANTKRAWIDKGSYQFRVLSRGGNEQYLFRADAQIEEDHQTLAFVPDKRNLKRVTFDPGKEDASEWMLGVAASMGDGEDAGGEDTPLPLFFYDLFPLDEGHPLYLQKDDYDFVLVKGEQQDETITYSVMQATPYETKKAYEFAADGKWSVKIEPDDTKYAPGREIEARVRVTDRAGNRLTDMLVMTENPADQLTQSLRLGMDKKGKWQMLAFDAKAHAYQPVSAQEVKPTIAWQRDGQTLDQSKDVWYWTDYAGTIPADWKDGDYELVWSCPQLSATGTAEVEIRRPSRDRDR